MTELAPAMESRAASAPNPLDAGAMLPLVRLLHLASPALPIGAYSYSQGLEWAVEDGTIKSAADAQAWIGDVLGIVVARGDAPIVWRLLSAAGNDPAAMTRWNAWYRASRESAELHAETLQMGQSLAKLALDLALLDAGAQALLPALDPVTLPAAYALVARGFAVPREAALAAWCWSWLENQVLAAMKLVPLGQVAGQRILVALGERIPAIAAAAIAMDDDTMATFAPGFALACARHETQYSRLFRS